MVAGRGFSRPSTYQLSRLGIAYRGVLVGTRILQGGPSLDKMPVGLLAILAVHLRLPKITLLPYPEILILLRAKIPGMRPRGHR